MNSLAQQLAKAGLVSQRTLKEAEAASILSLEQIGASKLKSITTVDDLKKCATVREFKEAAKSILLHDESQMSIIIKMAHDFKCDDGSKRLIGMLYALREALTLAPNEHEKIITKALRKAGGEVDIPNSTSKKVKNKKPRRQ